MGVSLLVGICLICRKNQTTRLWELLVLAFIGNQLDPDTLGIVVSIRYNEDLISVWNRDARNEETKDRILYSYL